jgi:DNA processing protein
LGVGVVEAAPRSGSLTTARLAAEAGHEVMAVPGSRLDPRSRGANDLIRQEAVPVKTAEDVLANLPERPRLGEPPLFAGATTPDGAAGVAEPAPESPLPPDSAADLAACRAQIFDLLGPSPAPVDAVMRRCQLSPPAVMVVLLELELAGRIETLPGGRVAVLADPPA